jgi:hypothetical protein
MTTENETTTDTAPEPAKPPLAPAPKILAELLDFLASYISCPDYQYIVLALWIVHTWCARAARFTPYLNIQAPGSQRGKTRCLQVLQMLCPPGTWMATAPSPGVLRRRMLALKPAAGPGSAPVQDLPPVLLLDDREATLGVSNSNYRLNSTVSLLKTGASAAARVTAPLRSGPVHEFSVYCPKALAGNSPLPNPLQERSIPILLKGLDNDEPPLKDFDPDSARSKAAPLVEWLRRWSEENLQSLRMAYFRPTEVPQQLNKRRLDYVLPLIHLCDQINGPWLTKGQECSCQHLLRKLYRKHSRRHCCRPPPVDAGHRHGFQ